MSLRNIFKTSVLVAALASTLPAFAATYYVVVPVPNRTATAGNLTVSLNGYHLPDATVGVPYAGFDFKTALQVRGDPAYTGAGVSFSVIGGALPSGLTLDSSSGVLSGTPTDAGTSTFQVAATYKSKSGQQSYTVVSVASTIVTAGSASITFPAVSDYTSVTQQLTLTNSGEAAGTLTLSSSSPNFTVSGCSTIAPKSTCTADIAFYPTGVANYTGQLTILGASNGTLTIPLSGSAVANVQTFTTSTNWTVPAKLTSVKVLVVGGGGGAEALGGTVPGGLGGRGGGGGQVVYNASYSVTPGANMAVAVGDGGDVGPDAGEDGQASGFGSITAAGGYSGFEGGASGNGNPAGGVQTTTLQGPGGGGAAGAGGVPDATYGGHGGPGACYDITGVTTCYGGGGGGGTYEDGVTQAAGGTGGGGIGGTLTVTGTGGAPNSGGGGGGGGGGGRAAGGSGVVIVAY